MSVPAHWNGRRHAVSAPNHELSLKATPFGLASTRRVVHLLSTPDRLRLHGVATRLRLPAGKTVYREASTADWLFLVADGVVKTVRALPSGKRRVMSFVFPGDIFGLAECGRYVNSAQTVTPVALYRIRVDQLMDMLRYDASLELQFLTKVTHELREAQRHTIVLSRRDAVGRLAMFLRMLDERERPLDGGSHIQIPMSRSDTASFLGLSLDAVTRAARRLEHSGLVAFDGTHTARILNRRRFEALASAV